MLYRSSRGSVEYLIASETETRAFAFRLTGELLVDGSDSAFDKSPQADIDLPAVPGKIPVAGIDAELEPMGSVRAVLHDGGFDQGGERIDLLI